jgi:hypothetical protein
VDGAAKNVPLPVKDILLDIHAHKFSDLNGNGTQDAGEPNLAGWTMTLYSERRAREPVNVTGNRHGHESGVTDASSSIDWTNLSAGDSDSNGDFSVAETFKVAG